MNTSGETADQIVRMSLEAGEVALKISGAGAKRLAVLLYAILKEQSKTRGRVRLETMIRSGKPLTVFTVREEDLKQFVKEAKRYGILYSAIRDPKGSRDGMVDIMVKVEDAPRINRIVERFKFACVEESAWLKAEKVPEKSKEVREGSKTEKTKPEQAEQLVDELLGETAERRKETVNPSMARAGTPPLSEPISEKRGKTGRDIFKPFESKQEKDSVKGKLRDIQADRKQRTGSGKDKNPIKKQKER